MKAAEGIVARARAAIGTPFRVHGRGLDGLDCVGLAGWAFETQVPTGYRLRSSDRARFADLATAAGLRAVDDARAGDLLLLAVGPGQLHLAIATDIGIVHADAGLKRVVERPGVPDWPIVGRWRKGG
jgi:cell wall-associated NlpC family hydrolase